MEAKDAMDDGEFDGDGNHDYASQAELTVLSFILDSHPICTLQTARNKN